MAQTFLDFFEEFELGEQLKILFEGAELDAVELYLETRRMKVRVCPPKLLPKKELFDAIEALKKIFSVDILDFSVKYDASLFSLDYLPEIVFQMKQDIAICNGFLDGCTASFEDGAFTILLQHGGADLMEEKGCLKYLEKLLFDEFNISATAAFGGRCQLGTQEVLDRSSLEKAMEEAQQLAASRAADAPQSSAPAERKTASRSRGAASAKREKPDMLDARPGQSIYGRQVRGTPMKLCDVRQDTGSATAWGDVFGVKVKETRDGKRLICLISITDYTSSIYVKLFDLKERIQPVVDKVAVMKKGEWRAKPGTTILASGSVGYDKYEREIVITADGIASAGKKEREDTAAEKRVELHLHTNMSQMDGITEMKKYVARAAKWGHKAIAVTDHGVLQAFPDAAAAAKDHPEVKILYGVEAYYVDDTTPAVYGGQELPLDGEFIVFDVETTGLNAGSDRLTEIGAVRLKDGAVVDSFNTFVNPGIPIPDKIIRLTGITDQMVADAPHPDEALKAFLEFAGDNLLIAHNAPFDIGFIKAAAARAGVSVQNPYLDTVPCARFLYPGLKNHKLNTVAQHVGAGNFNHHRACDDAAVLAKIFIAMAEKFHKEFHARQVADINRLLSNKADPKKLSSYHMIILAKNQIGLKNLYKLVSAAHLDYFHKRPRIPKSLLLQHREGLILGSACEAGELYNAVVHNRPWRDLCKIGEMYDYLEVQPLCNNQFLIDNGTTSGQDGIRDWNRTIIRLGETLQKPVVATCDAHFLDEQEEVFRRIILAGNGFSDADKPLPLYMRTTDEMLEEFSYLGAEKAYEVVVQNPNLVADWCEPLQPVMPGKFPPHMDNAKEDLDRLSQETAKKLYGEKLPPLVQERMDKELNSIIGNGYAVMYMIAQKLVQKSLSDGYLVGSRGSVGSSFVAFLSGITEVNSLCPHYICDHCHHVEWINDGSYEAGCDMPDQNCPMCGQQYRKDGFDIPFETFLGFKGDKEPDIDLNFSGEYQPRAHKYTEELFGEGYVFRAGTIGAIADKTAYGYVKKYLDEREMVINRAEEDRLVKGCTGIKRTTGQHPGGIVIVPKTNEVYDFTPVQHPADDPNSSIITTHFDYNCLHETLLKLDILGHDDPTMIRMLEDLTGLNAKEIPLDDEDTLSIFTSNEIYGIEPDGIITEVGTIAIPEFGTSFVRQMLEDTSPVTFGELVRISGLSHGTDVWLNNAQDLVRSGTATLKEAICTRDDIMLYLIHKGVQAEHAFKIMEGVRKGKGLNGEQEAEMKENSVPQWYIDSCKKIKYMFPKAHAVAYVTMAFRIAYFKVHYAPQFYASYFTVRADDFDSEYMIYGIEKVRSRIKQLSANQEMTAKDKNTIIILEVCYEMYKRGYKFLPIDLYQSDAHNFIVTEDGLLPPLNSLQGVGDNAAMAICEARKDGKFISVDEMAARSKVSKTVVEALDRNQVFKGIPKQSQMSMF